MFVLFRQGIGQVAKMNKLTPEQRDEILDARIHNAGLDNFRRWLNQNTANTAENEPCSECGGEGRIWLMGKDYMWHYLNCPYCNTEPEDDKDFRGRLGGETNWQQQQREANTEPEDENQIALRKIEEWWGTLPSWLKVESLNLGSAKRYIDEWLQSEDK